MVQPQRPGQRVGSWCTLSWPGMESAGSSQSSFVGDRARASFATFWRYLLTIESANDSDGEKLQQ